jgi:hypothetical protein
MQPQKPRDVAIDLRHSDQVKFRSKPVNFSGIVTRSQLQTDALGISEIKRQPATRFSCQQIVSKNLIIRMLHIPQAAKPENTHRNQRRKQHKQRDEKTSTNPDRTRTHPNTSTQTNPSISPEPSQTMAPDQRAMLLGFAVPNVISDHASDQA